MHKTKPRVKNHMACLLLKWWTERAVPLWKSQTVSCVFQEMLERLGDAGEDTGKGSVSHLDSVHPRPWFIHTVHCRASRTT